jgi:hypothetical protein
VVFFRLHTSLFTIFLQAKLHMTDCNFYLFCYVSIISARPNFRQVSGLLLSQLCFIGLC